MESNAEFTNSFLEKAEFCNTISHLTYDCWTSLLQLNLAPRLNFVVIELDHT